MILRTQDLTIALRRFVCEARSITRDYSCPSYELPVSCRRVRGGAWSWSRRGIPLTPVWPSSSCVEKSVAMGMNTQPSAVAVVDVDSDGKLDLVVALRMTNQVAVVLNRGGGVFLPAINYPTGLEPISVAYGDFNLVHRPGRRDLDARFGEANRVFNNASQRVHDLRHTAHRKRAVAVGGDDNLRP